jgi:hemerythrin-like domain-containing protein
METTTEQPSLRQEFGAHHRALEQLFEQVCASLRSGNADEARRLWTTLDRELDAHIELEEREMFPRLAEHQPAEVEGLRSAHVELRRQVAELGTAVDLKQLSEATATAFFDKLRAHAAREDSLLYRWADRELRDHRSLLARFRQLLRA